MARDKEAAIAEIVGKFDSIGDAGRDWLRHKLILLAAAPPPDETEAEDAFINDLIRGEVEPSSNTAGFWGRACARLTIRARDVRERVRYAIDAIDIEKARDPDGEASYLLDKLDGQRETLTDVLGWLDGKREIINVPPRHGMSRSAGVDWATGHAPTEPGYSDAELGRFDLTEHGEEALGDGASVVAFEGLLGSPVDWDGVRRVLAEKSVKAPQNALVRVSVEVAPIMNEQTGRPLDVQSDDETIFSVPGNLEKGSSAEAGPVEG